MDFESTYTSPRHEAVRSLRRLQADPRFSVKPDALAMALAKQARTFGYAEAPQAVDRSGQTMRRWYAALAVLFAMAVFGGMALLMAMGSQGR